MDSGQSGVCPKGPFSPLWAHVITARSAAARAGRARAPQRWPPTLRRTSRRRWSSRRRATRPSRPPTTSRPWCTTTRCAPPARANSWRSPHAHATLVPMRPWPRQRPRRSAARCSMHATGSSAGSSPPQTAWPPHAAAHTHGCACVLRGADLHVRARLLRGEQRGRRAVDARPDHQAGEPRD